MPCVLGFQADFKRLSIAHRVNNADSHWFLRKLKRRHNFLSNRALSAPMHCILNRRIFPIMETVLELLVHETTFFWWTSSSSFEFTTVVLAFLFWLYRYAILYLLFIIVKFNSTFYYLLKQYKAARYVGAYINDAISSVAQHDLNNVYSYNRFDFILMTYFTLWLTSWDELCLTCDRCEEEWSNGSVWAVSKDLNKFDEQIKPKGHDQTKKSNDNGCLHKVNVGHACNDSWCKIRNCHPIIRKFTLCRPRPILKLAINMLLSQFSIYMQINIRMPKILVEKAADDFNKTSTPFNQIYWQTHANISGLAKKSTSI